MATKTITLELNEDDQKLLSLALTKARTYWHDRAYALPCGDNPEQFQRIEKLLKVADRAEKLWCKVNEQIARANA